jgi:hypothetical protein
VSADLSNKDKLFYFVNYDGQRRSFPILFPGPSSSPAFAAVNAAKASNCMSTVNKKPVSVVGLTTAQCNAAIDDILGNIGAQPRTGNQDIFLGKLDLQASTNNRLNVSFNWMNWHNPNGAQSATSFTAGSNTQNGTFDTHERFLVASWNSVISPTMVNDFRFQWSRDFQFYSANFSGPSVQIGSLFGYGMPNFLPRAAFPDEHRLQFTDSVSLVHDKHTIKMGVDISPVHELLINLFQGGGLYSYTYTDKNAAATLVAWVADVYNLPLSNDPSINPATDPLLSKHYNTFVQAKDVVNPASQAGKDDFYDVDYAAYVQDTWKLRPSLTLNLGLRYDLQWIPQPPRPNPNPLGNIYTSKINIATLDFGPRLGFAWQASKNTVVRGGYGIFYANTTNSLYYNTRVENGVFQLTFNCNAGYDPNSAIGSPSACAPAFPNILFAAPGPALQAPFSGALTPQALNVDPSTLPLATLAFRGQAPNMLEPMVHEAEIGYERELPWNMSTSATYMITKGQHLPVCADANLAPPTGTISYNVGSGTFLNGSMSIPSSVVTVPFFTQRLNSGVGIVSACRSIVHSRYNAGIFTLKKQFSHGFELLANYTLAKTKDDGQVLGDTGTFNGSSDAPLNPLNQEFEWGNSDFDQRQRFVTSFLWTPSLKVGNSILNYLANGFGFGGIVNIASPFPVNALLSSSFTPCLGPSCAKFGVNPCTQAGDVCGVDFGTTGVIEINAGSQFGAGGRAPNFPKNSFRGRTQVRTVDFRITKDLKLWKERYKMQIIAEAFNLFNHTVGTGVTTPVYAYAANGSSSCSSANFPNGFPCLVPQTSFLTTSATGSSLVGPRQMQFSVKLNF